MIQSTGVFLDTSGFTAMFVVKYRDRMRDGILKLRDVGEAGEAEDLPILKEWKTARALLARYRAAGEPILNGEKVLLGKVWLETLPGQCGTPWTLEEDDYAMAHIRTRICLLPAPNAFSHSGGDRVLLGVGVVNVVEHRILHSETNLSTHPRTHLIVDVKRPDEG
jgi:hypothetical protein